jgi:hypothetical protein
MRNDSLFLYYFFVFIQIQILFVIYIQIQVHYGQIVPCIQFTFYLLACLLQNHLRNERFVSQDHIGGFSTKRECANTHK